MTRSSVPGGILLPVEVLQSEWFAVLAAFVAMNTLIYVTLAVATMLPRIHPGDWLYRVRGRNLRRMTRSIYPDDSPVGPGHDGDA